MGACSSKKATAFAARQEASAVVPPAAPAPPVPPQSPLSSPFMLHCQSPFFDASKEHSSKSSPESSGEMAIASELNTPPQLSSPDEAGRLAAVRELGLLGGAPMPQLDSITNLMRDIFGTPVAAITLMDADVHFVSRSGEWACSAARPGSFCDWILVPEMAQLLVVEDAMLDPRFCHNIFVAGPPHIRFYAGAPLVSSNKLHRYGTLCVFDFQPRSFEASQYAMLAHFAEMAVRELEREVVLEGQKRDLQLKSRHLARAMSCFTEGVSLLDLSSEAGWRLVYANSAFRAAASLAPLQRASAPASADFWQLFEMPAGGVDPNTLAAAQAAVQAGNEFTLQIRAKPPHGTFDCGPALTMVLRPAGGPEPLAGAPSIGVPGWVSGGGRQSAPASAAFSSSVFCFGIISSSALDALPGLLSSGAVSLDSLPSSLSPWDGGEAGTTNLPAIFHMRPAVMEEAELGPLIGVGANGRCYRGTWQGGRVAIKVIECSREPGVLAGKGSRTASAELEAILGRALCHPHILATYCHAVSSKRDPLTGRLHERVWIVTELATRGSLLDGLDRGLTQRPPEQGGGPHLPTILAAATDIAGAMAFLHSHDVIHGDLTPSNVLLTGHVKDARRWVCKVGDFGLARALGAHTNVVTSLGTVTHMPPEMLTARCISKATDVWSFGIIVLEMYYGQRAWFGMVPQAVLVQAMAGTLPFDLPSRAPPAFAELLGRCLSLDPGERPSFSTILSELRQLAQGQQREPVREAVPAVSAAVPAVHAMPKCMQQQQQQRSSSAADTPQPTTPNRSL